MCSPVFECVVWCAAFHTAASQHGRKLKMKRKTIHTCTIVYSYMLSTYYTYDDVLRKLWSIFFSLSLSLSLVAILRTANGVRWSNEPKFVIHCTVFHRKFLLIHSLILYFSRSHCVFGFLFSFVLTIRAVYGRIVSRSIYQRFQ